MEPEFDVNIVSLIVIFYYFIVVLFTSYVIITMSQCNVQAAKLLDLNLLK